MHKLEQELKSIVVMYSNVGPTLTELEINNCTATLRRLVLKTRQMNEPTFDDLKLLLAWTTGQLEQILKVERLDDAVYEQGCLNELYADILQYFNYPIERSEKEQLCDYVYWGSEK